MIGGHVMWAWRHAPIDGHAPRAPGNVPKWADLHQWDDLHQWAYLSIRAGETVCRSYSGHLNARQHDRHKTVPEEQMLVLAHYVTRSFDDYISRKLPRPSGVYAHTFNRMSRSKAAAKMSNETLFDEFEEEQHFNGQDPVCSSIVRNRYAERCCTGSLEEEQSTGASLDTAGQDSSSDDEEER